MTTEETTNLIDEKLKQEMMDDLKEADLENYDNMGN